MSDHIVVATEMILLETERELDRVKEQRDQLYEMVLSLDFETLPPFRKQQLDKIHIYILK